MKGKSQSKTGLAALVSGTVDDHDLLAGVQRLGVAVSGGSDSIALLYLLLPMCYAEHITPVILHLNHGLRGVASDGDEAFVRALCIELNLACEVGHAHLAGARPQHKGVCQSLEMAARHARLSFFRQAVYTHRLDAVAVGHHRDDAAETVLLRLVRGAGATGLSGIRPRTILDGLMLIRPLLDAGREELRAWLRQEKHAWREDASNSDLTIPRNRIRQSILPALAAAFGPSVATGLARSADLLREDDAALMVLADAVCQVVCRDGLLSLAPLLQEPESIRRRVVYQWLLVQGGGAVATYDTVRRILAQAEACQDWVFSAAGDASICCQSGTLSLVHRRPPECLIETPARRTLRRNGTVDFNGVRVTVTVTRGIVRESGPVGALPAQCTLAVAALRGKRLAVRYRQPGDRIAPLGMKGSRKVQDVLTDAKMPPRQRDHLPLLICGDEVIWIPGYRIAARYAVPASDASSLLVSMATHPL